MNLLSAANDIDLKMVEFFNLNSDYYKDLDKIEKKDYFKLGTDNEG